MDYTWQLRWTSHESSADLTFGLGEHVLGSSVDVDLQVNDPTVSRSHARLTVTEEGVTVEDLGSTNGTVVNGERLEAPMLVTGRVSLKCGKASFVLEKAGQPTQIPKEQASADVSSGQSVLLGSATVGFLREQGNEVAFPAGDLKWTPFFRPGVKVEKVACSMTKGAVNEEDTNETQSGLQGQGCLGGATRAGDGSGAIASSQGSRESDLQVEAAASGERHSGFRFRGEGRSRRCVGPRIGTASEDRRADGGEGFFITGARSIAMKPRRALVEPNAAPSTRRQCELLGVNRSSLYYEPVEPDAEELELMRRMDELHLKHPFFGSRMMTQTLKAEGRIVNRKRVQRLMRLMGLESTAPKPNTSKPAPEHAVYPYLLRNLKVFRINQVWAADITYIPMARGFLFLVAIIDWYSRRVLAWRLSTTLETSFCVEALNEALARYGCPEIFNTDQGCQFTSEDFTDAVLDRGIKISMDGKGRFIDNIFVERLWRSLKYEEVYLYAYDDVPAARAGIARYFDFFNDERPHEALGYQTPASFYDGHLEEVA